MTDDSADAILEEMPLARLVEHIARRVGLAEGELRFAVKDGRYQRAHVHVPIGAFVRYGPARRP